MIDPTEEQQQERVGRGRTNGRRAQDVSEDRVRKLEEMVTELAAKVSGGGVADRVLANLGEAATGVLYDAAGAVAAHPLALLSPPAEPPPVGAVLHPPPPVGAGKRKWFLVQVWTEFRLAVRMYFDPRYRISRTAQFLLPAILGLFGLNYFFFDIWCAIPIVSPIAERLVCVMLGICFYRLVVWELTRYREVLDYLAKYPPR